MTCENREYHKVVEYIKDLVSAEKIHVGDKLPAERVIAERLSISRNSTREALRTLENMGLIESKQGSGNYLVGDITQNMVNSLKMMLMMKSISPKEIIELRRYMELAAFTIAVDHHTDINTDEIAVLLDKMQQPSLQNQIWYDKSFHYILLEASENHLIMSIMNALSEIYENFVGYVLTTADSEMKKHLSQVHRTIYQSLVDKDKESGIQAINDHYDIIEKGLKAP